MRKLRKTLSFVIVLSFMLSFSAGALAEEIALGGDNRPTSAGNDTGWSYPAENDTLTISSGSHSVSGTYGGMLQIGSEGTVTGGSFTGGSGNEKHFDGPVWPAKSVIGVTLNYRLGPMGFVCLPELAQEAGHTGNYGMYDQIAALQWVRDNIKEFGGNI